MASVTLRNVGKVYPDGTEAVRDLSLTIPDGELVVLVGPSGSGKTTALRMVAGLEELTSGEIDIGGRVVNNVPARDRDIAMVFQNYALYPHMSVFDNIGFGLRLRKQKKDVIRDKVLRSSQMLGLDAVLAKKPRELSGGQRQRVAMGRAIVREPQVFLMDEPLSNLDAQLRVQMRAEIRRLQRELGVTMLYVTHDQVEAMTLGDRVAVFREGILQQADRPAVLYQHPANLFVAGFIGSPSMNLLRGTVEAANGGSRLAVGSGRLPLPSDQAVSAHARESYAGRELAVGIRPEGLNLAPRGVQDGTLTATIELVELLGAEALLHASVDASSVLPAAAFPNEGGARIVARVDLAQDMEVGDIVELSVDPRHVHLFDLETGDSIATYGTSPAVHVPSE